MSDEELRAKVFISCGQTRGSEEVQIAHSIAERLLKLGFDPYIAVEEQTLRGVKENIFAQLETSEYFLFVDFKREPLVSGSAQLHRGSLFCHQELALASYFDIPLAAFQEKGVKQEDGLMGFLQGNSTPFTDRHTLPNVIADIVCDKWNPSWKNALKLDQADYQPPDLFRYPEEKHARFYHVKVENLHPRKTALNCYVYLERLVDLSSNTQVALETIEFKWAGYLLPNAIIGPKSVRHFDAFFVFHEIPNKPHFNLFTDSGLYVPKIGSGGDFELTFVVISENFRPARRKFLLHLDRQLSEINFKPI